MAGSNILPVSVFICTHGIFFYKHTKYLTVHSIVLSCPTHELMWVVCLMTSQNSENLFTPLFLISGYHERKLKVFVYV